MSDKVWNLCWVDTDDNAVAEETMRGSEQECISKFKEKNGLSDDILVENINPVNLLKNGNKYKNKERITIMFSHWAGFLSW